MFSIALIHSGKNFKPEIGAYQNYFEDAGIKTGLLVNPSQPEMEPYDILWFSCYNTRNILIHCSRYVRI